MAKAEAKGSGASVAQRRAPLSADDRGALLGEAQLAAAAAASSTAAAPAGPHAAGPNISGIAGMCLMPVHMPNWPNHKMQLQCDMNLNRLL